MNATWATVATFSFVSEAQVMRTLLESEGISVLIPEEYTAGVTGSMMTAMTVRVQVPEQDAERARELIAAYAAAPAADAPSAEAFSTPDEVPAKKPRRLANLARAVLGMIAGVPMRRKDR